MYTIRHNVYTLNHIQVSPDPALTLLPWLEYFFTESASPWTKRRSTVSYSADVGKRNESYILERLRSILICVISLLVYILVCILCVCVLPVSRAGDARSSCAFCHCSLCVTSLCWWMRSDGGSRRVFRYSAIWETDAMTDETFTPLGCHYKH